MINRRIRFQGLDGSRSASNRSGAIRLEEERRQTLNKKEGEATRKKEEAELREKAELPQKVSPMPNGYKLRMKRNHCGRKVREEREIELLPKPRRRRRRRAGGGKGK
ncbi:MAG: hypothetical protein Ct9H300mP8_06540 [Gammaproteobacteria bacterium]|nr:MAG: hypothetical protein Ct9H300mP8_06540 [Gammaproteobacteria bacterium]